MGFNHIEMFANFYCSGIHHLELCCYLIIEAWLKFNMYFDTRYLVLIINACIVKLVIVYIILNVRNGIEF